MLRAAVRCRAARAARTGIGAEAASRRAGFPYFMDRARALGRARNDPIIGTLQHLSAADSSAIQIQIRIGISLDCDEKFILTAVKAGDHMPRISRFAVLI